MIIAWGLSNSEHNLNSGRIGIWIAAKRFDLTRNVRFSTYAIYWIRASIYRGNWMLANERRIIEHCTSIYTKEGELLPLYKEQAPRPEIIIDNFLESIKLNARDRTIFDMRRAGYSLMAIGTVVGYSKQRVSQIFKKIIEKIRKRF